MEAGAILDLKKNSHNFAQDVQFGLNLVYWYKMT